MKMGENKNKCVEQPERLKEAENDRWMKISARCSVNTSKAYLRHERQEQAGWQSVERAALAIH